jgi:hypothetical protein
MTYNANSGTKQQNKIRGSSTWLTTVPKRILDGKPKYRSSVDFRALNAVTNVDTYPFSRKQIFFSARDFADQHPRTGQGENSIHSSFRS